MDQYLLLMRLDIITKEAQPSPEQLQVYMKQYHEWVAGIAAENKFVSGTALSTEGRVLQSDKVPIDGPFAEIKESIAGFITIRVESFDDAAKIAADCPILNGEGNSVEVRKITSVNENG
ncbi:YciI family protein [Dyadobacter bucti]|uniref:YciI family protein n=1 Tax=Dyadobacter bucti TaxID=2572203 RepID=UPI003F7045D9